MKSIPNLFSLIFKHPAFYDEHFNNCLKGVSIVAVYGNTVIKTADEYGLGVIWNNGWNLRVTLLGYHFNKTSGLCGTYNGIQNDDFLTPSGTTVADSVEFGNSWKIDPQCEDAVTVPNPCDANPLTRIRAASCSSLLNHPFENCPLYLNPDRYIHNCEYDMCACEDDAIVCYCQSVDAYADNCAKYIGFINWRGLGEFTACSK